MNNQQLMYNQQEAQLMLTTGSTRARPVEVNKHGTIPHVTYSFLLCNSNFVFKGKLTSVGKWL